MDPGTSALNISDVVESIAGHDAGKLFYVVSMDDTGVYLVNGKDRTLDKPKLKKRKHVKKVLRAETRVAARLRAGDKVLNSELRRDLAEFSQEMQSKT